MRTGACASARATTKGTYRIMSAVDLEATFRKHEPDPAVLGSNAMVATTATRIRAAVIRTGSTPDQEAPVAVLTQQRAAQQPLPPVLIMDQAGGMGKTRAQVETVSDGQTQHGRPHSACRGGGSSPLHPGRLSHEQRWPELYLSTGRDQPPGVCPCPGRRGLLPLLRRRVSGLSALGGVPRAHECAHESAGGVPHALSRPPPRRRGLQRHRRGARRCCGAAGRWSQRLPGWCATTAAARRGGWDWRPRNASCSRRAPCATSSCGWAGWSAGKRRHWPRSQFHGGTTVRRWRWPRNGVAAHGPHAPLPVPTQTCTAVPASSVPVETPRPQFRINLHAAKTTPNCRQGPRDPYSAKLS